MGLDNGAIDHLKEIHIGQIFIVNIGKNINVMDGRVHDSGFHLEFFEGFNFLPDIFGLFKSVFPGEIIHQLMQIRDNIPEISLEDVMDLVDGLVIVFLCLQRFTRSFAISDMIFQAYLEFAF